MKSSPLNRPGRGGAVKRLVRRPSRFNFLSTLAIKSEKHSFQNLKGPTQITSTGHCLRQVGHHCNTSVGCTIKALSDQGVTIPPWPFNYFVFILSFNMVLFLHYHTVPHFLQKRIISFLKNSHEGSDYTRKQKSENGNLYNYIQVFSLIKTQCPHIRVLQRDRSNRNMYIEIYTHMYIYIHTHTHTHTHTGPPHIYIHTHTYIYINMEQKREKERERLRLKLNGWL